ncbi:MAG: DUF1015 family protein [Actinomycetota bacterium]
MFHPFQALVYTDEAIAEFGEPTRLSSDRAPGVRNPISVNALHAGYEEGSYLRGEHRCRAMLDRSVMVENPSAFVDYRIERQGTDPLRGVVGILNLDRPTLHMHEAVMASAVAARSADIERAGAFLEPVVVATRNGSKLSAAEGLSEMRAVTYGDARHSVAAIPPDYDHGLEAETEFVVIDGHHRIAAARQHASLSGIEPSVLALVVDIASPGLFVVPQHRVIGGHGIDLGSLPSHVAVAPYERGDAVPPGSVALVGRGVSALLSVPGSPSEDPVSRISSVTLTHHLIEPLDLWVQGFATREVDAYAEVDGGASAVAIMGDLSMADIVATASAGIVLPEKTTCFSPKVAVGLVGVTA